METMRANKLIVFFTIAIALLMLFGLINRFRNSQKDDEQLSNDNSEVASTPVSYIEPEKSEALKIVENMTLREKVSQMFVFAFLTPELLPEEQSFLQTYKPGGVVFLGENVSDETQIKNLTASIQSTNPNLKLFTLIDQEGGVVKRIYWDNLGSAKDISGLGSEEICSRYKQRSELLGSLGINFNLGIVADVTSDSSSFIFDRVFSGDYGRVSEIVAIATKCSEPNINAVKHFPGHGATNLDTHQGLATISKSKEEWESSDLLSFKSAIENNAKSVMISHLILNWLDSENPASLSKTDIDYLRNELGFKGLIITDDLRMLDSAGLEKHDVLKRAIIAGNNILLYSTYDYAEKAELIDFAVSQVEAGLISEKELNDRVLKIVEQKLEIN